MINLLFQARFWSSFACIHDHTWEDANSITTISTLMNERAGRVWHIGRLSNAVGCLDFLKCVYFLPPFQPPITPLRVELQAADVCLPSRVQPISVVSVSQWGIELCVETHQPSVHHQNDVRCYANIALQAICISILKFWGEVLPCPFAVPRISITYYTMKFSWTALAGRESCEVIFTGYCYRISKGDSWPSSCKQKQD